MTKEPVPDERYQDALTMNVFEVVGLATSSETCQRLVIYRLMGRERLFTTSLDHWEELLDSDGLAFVGHPESEWKKETLHVGPAVDTRRAGRRQVDDAATQVVMSL